MKNLEVRVANSQEDREKCFRVRFRSYEDMGYVTKQSCPEQMLYDDYDDMSTIYLAEKNGKEVGTIRLTPKIEGIPLDIESFFDMSEFEKEIDGPWIESSKVMVDPEYQRDSRILLKLINALYCQMKKEGINHLCYMAIPEQAKMYERVAVVPFDGPVHYPKYEVDLFGLHWDIRKLPLRYKKLFDEAKNISID